MTTMQQTPPLEPQPVPVETPAAPAASALPVQPRAYHHFLRTPRARWWKGLLAILAMVVALLVVNTVASIAAVAIDIATGRTTSEAMLNGDVSVTPMLFLFNNLSLAALLPIAMLLQWAFHGVRPRWLSSVQGGFRWRWFGRSALLIVPIFVVYVGLGYFFMPSMLGRVSADAALMLAVVLITTPFQAAGEEYAFRGFVARAAGSWTDRPVLALVVGGLIANVLFMAAHAATDPWLISYYFVFGVALSVIAWRTGGLEVPVLIHLVNNVLLLVPTALFGDLSDAFDRGPGTGGPFMLVPMALLVALVGLIEWWTRRNRTVRVSTPETAAA